MRKIIVVILLLFLNVYFGQTEIALFKTGYPHLVPENSKFQISIITRLLSRDLTRIQYFVSTDNNFKIDSAIAGNALKSKKMKLGVYSSDDGSENYKVEISDSNFISSGFFQLKLYVSPITNSLSKIDFLVNLFDKDGEKYSYNSLDYEQKNSIEPAVISFYKDQSFAGKAVEFRSNSYLQYSDLKGEIENNVVDEFWIKFNRFEGNFLEISKLNGGSFILGINKFGMLKSENKNFNNIFSKFYQELFISSKVWNHIVVAIDRKTNSLRIFANSDLFAEFDYPIINRWSDLSFKFTNNSASGNFQLDLLKVWDSSKELDFFNKERHFKYLESDSTINKLILDFDDKNTLEKIVAKNDFINLKLNQLRFVESNAPIFSRAPKLSSHVSGRIVYIEWKPADAMFAEEFVLERSLEGSTYDEIYSTTASDDPENIYYYSDRKDDEADVIYYRIKQVNFDGSIAYSPSVKVGLGQKEVFSIINNFPNPFNPSTTISIEVLEVDEFEITVYDIVGNKIERLYEGPLAQGRHSFEFDGSDLTSGIYLYEVKTPHSLQVEKMILAK